MGTDPCDDLPQRCLQHSIALTSRLFLGVQFFLCQSFEKTEAKLALIVGPAGGVTGLLFVIHLDERFLITTGVRPVDHALKVEQQSIDQHERELRVLIWADADLHAAEPEMLDAGTRHVLALQPRGGRAQSRAGQRE